MNAQQARRASRHPIPDAARDDRGVVSRVRKGPKADPRPCACCGTSFAPHRKRADARFCSKACIWKATKGTKFNAMVARETAAARGDKQRGRGAGKGYRKLNGRHEHRVIAEGKLGRPLAPGEIVHHADENKLNNDPGNIDVIASQSEHARHHFTGKKQSLEHVAKRVAARSKTMRKMVQA